MHSGFNCYALCRLFVDSFFMFGARSFSIYVCSMLGVLYENVW